MKSDSLLKQVGRLSLSIVGAVAIVLAVGAAGWKLAAMYYGLTGKVSTIHTSALATELDLANKQLKEKVKDQEATITELNERLAKASGTRTDKEWDALGRMCLSEYSTILTCMHTLSELKNRLDPSLQELIKKSNELQRRMPNSTATTCQARETFNSTLSLFNQTFDIVSVTFSAMSDVAELLRQQNTLFFGVLTGAGLLETSVIDGNEDIMLRTCPSYAVNSTTGEVKKFTSSTTRAR